MASLLTKVKNETGVEILMDTDIDGRLSFQSLSEDQATILSDYVKGLDEHYRVFDP